MHLTPWRTDIKATVFSKIKRHYSSCQDLEVVYGISTLVFECKLYVKHRQTYSWHNVLEVNVNLWIIKNLRRQLILMWETEMFNILGNYCWEQKYFWTASSLKVSFPKNVTIPFIIFETILSPTQLRCIKEHLGLPKLYSILLAKLFKYSL